MLSLLLCGGLFVWVSSLVLSSLWVSPNRYSVFLKSIFGFLSSAVSSHFVYLFSIVLFSVLILNVFGNIPGFYIPTMFYFYTGTVALVFWVALMGVISLTQFKSFIAHMLPYGAPVGLMFVLPLIEVFSNLIRPFTLMVRLSTNLSAGHIMMYMFSYFAVSSIALGLPISLVLGVLFVLELLISCLQAYIFSSLLILYVDESLWSGVRFIGVEL